MFTGNCVVDVLCMSTAVKGQVLLFGWFVPAALGPVCTATIR